MMIRRVNPAEFQKLIDRYRRQLAKVNGDAAEVLGRIGTRLESQIVRMLLDGTYQIDEYQLARLNGAIRRMVAGSDADFMRLMEEHVPAVQSIAFERTVQVLAVSEGVSFWNRITERRVVETLEHFERDLTDRTLLRRAGPYVERWAGEWNDEWTRVQRSIQASFTQGMTTGMTNQDVAKGLVGDLGELKIAGRLSPDDFAKAFTRTKFGELYTDFAIQVSKEAGVENYVNFGVADERQSEICNRASNAGPHPLDWWMRSEFGIPPRHVMNCRCTLSAVSDLVKDRDWSQPNPKFEKEEVTA